MIKRNQIVILFSFVFILKAIAACLFPVVADEAYYYIWSKNLQLSYFDHPPLVSWLIYISTFLSSTNEVFLLRLPFLLLSTGTLGVWLYLGQQEGWSLKSIFWFIVIYNLNPLLGLGSVIATPDVPLVFFWSLSFLFFYKIFYQNKSSFRNYLALGVFLGLGFISKYHIVLFILSGVFYLLLSKKWTQISVKKSFLTVVAGALFCLPVIIWNYQNDWASFAFQLKHGFGKTHYNWQWTANYFLGQFLLVGPVIIFYLFKKSFAQINQIFSLTHLAFFISSSFKAIVEANWPISAQTHSLAAVINKLSLRSLLIHISYWVLIYSTLIFLIASGRLDKTLKNQYRSTQLDEIVEFTSGLRPLYGPSYQISSLLSWRLNEDIPKLKGLARFDFFESLPQSIPNENVFYVLKHEDSIWPENYINYKKTLVKQFNDLKIDLFKFEYE